MLQTGGTRFPILHKERMNAVKMKQLARVGLPLLALILELLPWGVTMRFANPDGAAHITKTCYFDLMPFGYANFGPLLTAVFTCILLALLLIGLAVKKQKLLRVCTVLAIAATVTSVLPLLYSSYTVIGGLITACLAGEVIVLAGRKR